MIKSGFCRGINGLLIKLAGDSPGGDRTDKFNFQPMQMIKEGIF
jgi:hypothetical protein